MTCQTETTQIGNHEYSVTQWIPEKALLMKFRAAQALGPAFGALLGDKEKGDAEAMGDAMGALFAAAPPETLVTLIKDVVVGVAIDGKKITSSSFNEHFSGDNLRTVYAVFAYTLKVNYQDFFKGLSVAGLKKKLKENL